MTSSPRRPGGQPGNQNSVKHGFYARAFTLNEQRDLDNTETINYGDEIALLRVSIRRLSELSLVLEDPLDLAVVVRVLALAATSLARLVSAQKLNVPQEDIGAAVREAVRNSMGHLPIFQKDPVVDPGSPAEFDFSSLNPRPRAP